MMGGRRLSPTQVRSETTNISIDMIRRALPSLIADSYAQGGKAPRATQLARTHESGDLQLSH